MPKVTQQYRDARRGQILAAATRCFLRNGFQGTSMQDLFTESKLSSGAFYLYFTSKDEVIIAIAEQNIDAVVSLLHELSAEPGDQGLGETLASVIGTVQQRHRDEQLGAMAVLVWSEVLRTPHLRTALADSLERLRTDLTAVVARHQRAGSVPDGVAPDAIAKLVMAIVPGVLLQLAIFGDAAVDGVADAARAVWP